MLRYSILRGLFASVMIFRYDFVTIVQPTTMIIDNNNDSITIVLQTIMIIIVTHIMY